MGTQVYRPPTNDPLLARVGANSGALVGWSGLRGRSMAGAKYGLTLSNRSVLLGMSTVEGMLGLAAAA